MGLYEREYQHNGTTYRLATPSTEYIRLLSCVGQRTKAHQLNDNKAGIYREIASTWGIMLGITTEEAAELPIRLLIEIMGDLEDASAAMKKALGSRK